MRKGVVPTLNNSVCQPKNAGSLFSTIIVSMFQMFRDAVYKKTFYGIDQVDSNSLQISKSYFSKNCPGCLNFYNCIFQTRVV